MTLLELLWISALAVEIWNARGSVMCIARQRMAFQPQRTSNNRRVHSEIHPPRKFTNKNGAPHDGAPDTTGR